jgi:hypothetical protein
VKTIRPRLLPNDAGYHVDEREAVSRRVGNAPSLDVGDAVVLRFRSRVRFRDGSYGMQLLRVAVTSVHRNERGESEYRGEVEWEVDRKLFRADELRRGQPVRFRSEHVVIVFAKTFA